VDSAIKTSLSLQAYGSGLMAFIAIKIFAPVFLSRGDTKTPVKAGIVAMVSNIILNLILVQFYGHIGLAVATSLSALLNASILYFYLIKQSIFKFDAAFYKMLTRVIFAVVVMSSYIMFFDTNIEAYFDSLIIDRCWLLFKSIAISASIYFLSLFVFGVRFKDL
jgi:putative peptidoglycan lipid II flippase